MAESSEMNKNDIPTETEEIDEIIQEVPKKEIKKPLSDAKRAQLDLARAKALEVRKQKALEKQKELEKNTPKPIQEESHAPPTQPTQPKMKVWQQQPNINDEYLRRKMKKYYKLKYKYQNMKKNKANEEADYTDDDEPSHQKPFEPEQYRDPQIEEYRKWANLIK